jgi:glycosyltransferase involved in cell wall biosynthesis
MQFWLIECGEPLPIDKEKGRLWRIGLLAEILLSRGHSVTWWASTFDHSHKVQRHHKDICIQVQDDYKIFLLKGPAYKKNISFKRILNHRMIARKFARLAGTQPLPDLIHCCLPTLENSYEATKFGLAHKIPVVVDIRDMWPDIMLDVLPKKLKPLSKLLLTPMYQSVRNSCMHATAISGMTSAFVDKGLYYANRSRSTWDRDFPFGYPSASLDDATIKKAYDFWKQFGIQPNNRQFIVCFFGALSPRMELKTMIKAAVRLNGMEKDILFVICGKGEEEQNCRRWASANKNVIFPGWVGLAEIRALMQMAAVGAIPYPSTEDFSASIPNKTVEYLSGGLPIISSVKGVLKELLSQNSCGITYENNDEESLVAVLTNLYDNPELLTSMSRQSRQLFESEFKAEKVYSEMSAYLESVASHYKRENPH